MSSVEGREGEEVNNVFGSVVFVHMTRFVGFEASRRGGGEGGGGRRGGRGRRGGEVRGKREEGRRGDARLTKPASILLLC